MFAVTGVSGGTAIRAGLLRTPSVLKTAQSPDHLLDYLGARLSPCQITLMSRRCPTHQERCATA
jgi:hypothetical protein